MEDFINVHRDCIDGVLHGFDRLIFRGTLRSISYADGLAKYMNRHGILLKGFDDWAQRCTKRLNGHLESLASASGRPHRYLPSTSLSKEQMAMEIAERDRIDSGLVCVLSCIEPCMSPQIHRNAQSRRLELVYTRRKCKFYYLYLIDRELGWMHVRIQSWLPFEVQVYVNGRTYLQKRLDRAGIDYQKRENCFTWIADMNRAQRFMDQFTALNWSRRLTALLKRYWPRAQTGLLPEGPGHYYWTIRQSELATDVMFKDQASLAGLYPQLCRHGIEGLSCQDILRFMGKDPSRGRGQVTSSCQKLVQGVRLKHQVDANTIKMYDKQGSVLRVETTINDPRKWRVYRGPLNDPNRNMQWRPMAKAVADIARRAAVCQAANERYLAAMAVVQPTPPVAAVLDPVSRPVVRKAVRHRGLRPVCPDDAALFEAVMDAGHLLDGITNGGLQRALYGEPSADAAEARRRSNAVGRKLRLLRQHGLIRKVGARRLYRVTPKGHQVMGLSLAIRQNVNTLLRAA